MARAALFAVWWAALEASTRAAAEATAADTSLSTLLPRLVLVEVVLMEVVLVVPVLPSLPGVEARSVSAAGFPAQKTNESG